MHHLRLSSPLLGDYETDSFPISVGRSGSCDFVIPNSGVSRVHAQICLEADDCVLSDQGSSNGTFVEGEKISGNVVLETGMRIQFGTCDFSVEMAIDSAPEAAADDPHHITTPQPMPNQVAEDEHTEMLKRPDDWDQLIGATPDDGSVSPSASAPAPAPAREITGSEQAPGKGFLAANWPWFVVLLLGPVIGWAAAKFFG